MALDHSFSLRVLDWFVYTFGEEALSNKKLRAYRFLEEALELGQALDVSKAEISQLVDYVYSRPAGEPVQEVGGVCTTLAVLCEVNDIDQAEAAETELRRIWTRVDVIRQKDAAKVGPLPGA